jgi:predicted RNA-binding protein with PUA domain
MKIYKLYKIPDGKDAAYTVNEDGSITSFIFDPANTDYQAYLKWLDEGNTPEPAGE